MRTTVAVGVFVKLPWPAWSKARQTPDPSEPFEMAPYDIPHSSVRDTHDDPYTLNTPKDRLESFRCDIVPVYH